MATPEVMLTPRLAEALAYAIALHRTQARKGTGIPYVAHLLAVCALVLEHGGSETQAIAALLHDAVEDQGGEPTRREIECRFGPKVAEIVAACSDTDEYPKPPWRRRKERYIREVRTAAPTVRLVSAADKLHNARAILNDYRVLGESLWQRFNAGPADILWYYRSLAQAFDGDDLPSVLVAELRRTVDAIDTLVNHAAAREGGER